MGILLLPSWGGAGGGTLIFLVRAFSGSLGGCQRRIGLGARADLRSCWEWYPDKKNLKKRKCAKKLQAPEGACLPFRLPFDKILAEREDASDQLFKLLSHAPGTLTLPL